VLRQKNKLVSASMCGASLFFFFIIFAWIRSLGAEPNLLTDEELKGLLPPEESHVLLFLRWISAGLFLVSLAIVSSVLFYLRRNPIPGTHARWLLFIGMALLPLTAMMFTTGVGFESAKKVSACSSCHEMDPFVNDMKNPKSETLAAVHYQNRYIQKDQCYTCHTGYGIYGTFQSKLAGLRHLWIHYTGGNSNEPIRMHNPFNFSSCMVCHGRAANWRTNEDHKEADTIQALRSGEITCLECHEPSHPPQEEE